MSNYIEFVIEEDNILDYQADVVALKFARQPFGADREARKKLLAVGIGERDLEPAVELVSVQDTRGALVAPRVVFVGTPRLGDFGYPQIRRFMDHALNVMVGDLPDTTHLAMTVHGPESRLKLDDKEAFLAQFMVCLAAIQTGTLPPALKRISVVEINHERVVSLRKILADFLKNDSTVVPIVSGHGFRLPIGITANKKRPRVFVAMSFEEALLDTYLFGVQHPILAAGLLPVRVDQNYIPGDVFADIKRHIRTADLIVADLTGARPNVYLEIGYALGKGRKPILLLQNGNKAHFDVQGLNWINYSAPKDLRSALAKAINQHLNRQRSKSSQTSGGSTDPVQF